MARSGCIAPNACRAKNDIGKLCRRCAQLVRCANQRAQGIIRVDNSSRDAAIMELHRGGFSSPAIAKNYKLTPSRIRYIIRRESMIATPFRPKEDGWLSDLLDRAEQGKPPT